MEKYFSLKSLKGPKNQAGIVLRSTSQGLLEDLTRMISLEKTKENHYSINIDINIFGQDKRKKEIVVLKVLDNAEIKIHKQEDYSIFLEEINETKAEEIESEFGLLRSSAQGRVRSSIPNNLDLGYFLNTLL